MKKTTEKKALRNIADIRADLETRANAYNAAINADDTKAAELFLSFLPLRASFLI